MLLLESCCIDEDGDFYLAQMCENLYQINVTFLAPFAINNTSEFEHEALNTEGDYVEKYLLCKINAIFVIVLWTYRFSFTNMRTDCFLNC